MNSVRKSPLVDIDKVDLQLLLNESCSFAEVLRKLGYVGNGGTHRTLYRRIESDGLNLDQMHLNAAGQKTNNTRKANKDVFVEQSTYDRGGIKKRLIENNLISYECSHCKNDGTWNGQPLSLHLEHINGIGNDHRLENLTFLCPNCHSQTATYGGKNKLKAVANKCNSCAKTISKGSTYCNSCRGRLDQTCSRPNAQTLILDITKLGFVGTGKKYSVSDNAIRKWCKQYGLPCRKKDLVALN